MLDALRSNPKQQRWLVFGLAFLVALVVIFGVWRAQSLVDKRPDPYWFAQMGRSVAEGKGFEGFGTLLHRRSPLYPLLLGAVFWLFGEHDVIVQLLQAAMFAGTCVLVYSMGRRLFNQRTGLLAALACCFHPSLLRYVPDYHLETLFTFLVTLAVWQSIRLRKEPSLRRALEFGVALGLACLTKAVFMLYPAVFVALWWWTNRKPVTSPRTPPRGASLPLVAGIFVAMGLTILPWTIRNYQATGGHIVPITTGMSDAFLRGYVFSKTEYATLQKPPYTDGENESNAMFRALCAAEGAVWEQDDLQTDKILNKAAKQRLLASPGDFLRKTAVGLFTFWYEMTSLTTSLVAGGTALIAWAFAAIGIVRARRERLAVWPLLAPVLYVNFLLAALLSLGRYSVPVLPCLLVVSAFGVDKLLSRFKKADAVA